MLNDSEKLKKFVQLLKDMRAIEDVYDDLLDFDIPNDPPDFFNLYGDFIENIEAVINVNNLTDSKVKKYDSLITEAYSYIRRDAPRLYQIAGNIEEVLYEGVEAASNTVKDTIKPFEGKRPIMPCGYSSLEIYIRPISFLGLLLQDESVFSLEGYKYSGGILTLDLSSIKSEFNLTGQEYEIFSSAYKAALEVLHRRLKVNGKIQSFID